MKLITELTESVQYKLVEDTTGKKSLFIEGIFIQGDITNKNGRMYPMNILEPEVERYIKEKIKANCAYGELSHPDGLEINPDRISHRIVELKKDGNNFIGKAKINEDLPCGKIAAAIIKDGGRLAVSTRGVGSLSERNGVQVVEDDFQLVTAADIVIDPSAPDAFVNGIMEGREWTIENGILKEVNQIRKNIDRVVKETKFDRQLREKRFIKLFDKLLKSI